LLAIQSLLNFLNFIFQWIQIESNRHVGDLLLLVCSLLLCNNIPYTSQTSLHLCATLPNKLLAIQAHFTFFNFSFQ
jgi:hypothetical protein